MEMKLKSCFLSLAMLTAVAARADDVMGAAGDGGDVSYDAAPAARAEAPAAPEYPRDEKKSAAPRAVHEDMEMGAAQVGSGSGEPARETQREFNDREFLRNVWTTP